MKSRAVSAAAIVVCLACRATAWADAPAPPAAAPSPSPLATAAAPADVPALEPASLERRSMGRFLPNLGRNLVHVVDKDNLKPFVIGAASTGASAVFDDSVQRYFEDHSYENIGEVGEALGQPIAVSAAAAALLVSGRVAKGARYRAATYDVAQAFLVNAAWTGALKYAVGRERPDGSNNHSFPSGHTSNAFAWATVADRHYGHKVGIPFYVLAGFVGLTRLEENVHHLSDVVAGAALGYIVGRTVVREDSRPRRAERQPEVSLAPLLPPRGRGAGLMLSVAF